ncbi:pikachurin-like [Achroia grisella]|uniref:pikachurin-like n=1 Tax=Achroia grisella TaxID=688607 RepID=UPI0027D1FC66|nr:pikachurin-like [Achroia grisella]
MACRSVEMGAPRVAPLAALLAALLAAATSHPPTQEPVKFEAAFQGRCGEGSPCEQLCRELHDGTYECGCGPGYVLHVDGYGCLELNATRPTDITDIEEDVLYQKDVSFSAELEIAPSNSIKANVSDKHIDIKQRLTTTLPSKKENYTNTGERYKEADGLKSLREDGVSNIDLNIIADDKRNVLLEANELKVTTLGPSLEQKVPGATVSPPWTAAVENCDCDCDGRCACPLAANKCKSDLKVVTPRFSGGSWLALRALRGAYKRVRLRIRVRPERARGVLLLTGEHDDLSGDYLALILRNGHVELRFDCGSGAGILRSPEPVRLGRWNTISVYRHRWDAWLRLNNGKRVRGRSKGLFSRMTFREPVWVGGAGNTTGLQIKLGLSDGLLGCVDFLRINGDTYRLVKDAVATLDIAECAPALAPWKPPNEVTTSESNHNNDAHGIYDINDIVHFEDNDIVMRDAKTQEQNNLDNSVEQFKNYRMAKDVTKIKSEKDTKINDINNDVSNDLNSDNDKAMRTAKVDDKCECHHGGGCVGGVCLCPLGYAGEKCEITLDLKVPRFNGSSYLRLPGLGNSAQSWLDIQITLKPTDGDGLVLYNSEHASGDGDFFSLHLRDYFVEFAFDLGSGIALVRSAYPLKPNTWHRVSVSRSGKHASLRVRASSTNDVRVTSPRDDATRSVTSRGAARRLTLRQPMLLGGAPHPLPPRLALRTSFSGCVGQLVINDEELAVVASALGGLNVDNCDEPNNTTCLNSDLCREILQPMLQYRHNISDNNIHHSIVPKKGFRPKYHKVKSKKHNQHLHTEKYKKKKYFASKKHDYLQDTRSNDVVTEKPVYDGQTYMQVKYLNSNEINWGDTNTYPSFTGTDSFIHIDDEETMKRLVSYSLDINIRFRSSRARGLLVWSGGRGPPHDFLSLAVEDSVLVFRYDLGSGEVVIIANHTKVDDGLWHRARATRNRQAGVLEVDGLGSVGKVSPGKLKQLNTDNGLYIGGLPSIEINSMGKYKTGLVGCVSQISLSGDFDIPLSLSKLPHTITNNVGRCTP